MDVLVVHFRKLKGHQSFALTPTQVKDFATKVWDLLLLIKIIHLHDKGTM